MTKKNLTLFLLFPFFLIAQNPCDDFKSANCSKFSESFEPTNLTEAISYLECIWGGNDLEKLKSYYDEDEETQIYVKRKIFCLEQILHFHDTDTQLFQFFFNKINDVMPSDVERIIYDSLHRKLNGLEINLDEQLEKYKEYYRKSKEKAHAEYIKRRNRDFAEFNVGDIVEFTYRHYFLKRPEDCKVEAFVNEIDTKEFMLKLEIIENCENEEFQVVHSEIYFKENEKCRLSSKEILNLRPNGEIIWTPYYYWTKTK
jgi:hypothetical protein